MLVLVAIDVIVGLALVFLPQLMDPSNNSDNIIYLGIFIAAGGPIITSAIIRIIYETVKKTK